MKNLLPLFSALLVLIPSASAQEKLSLEKAIEGARLLTKIAVADAPFKTDLDLESPFALKAGEVRVLAIPSKSLSKKTLTPADKAITPVGQLWMMKATPARDGKVLATDKLRWVTIKDQDDDMKVQLYFLGSKKNDKGGLDLVIYGKEKEPLLRVEMEKMLRQHNLWVLFLHKPHSEPVISGLSNLFATANVWSPVPPEAAKLPSSRRASGGDELRASSSRRRRSLRVTDSPACCWEASFSPTDSAIEPKK